MAKISLSTVVIICILLLTSSVLYARIGSVYGLVVDKFTKKPVSMAKVCLLGAIRGQEICKNTYPDGAYLLDTLAGSNYVIKISATGYRTFESSPINVPSGGYINLPAQFISHSRSDPYISEESARW